MAKHTRQHGSRYYLGLIAIVCVAVMLVLAGCQSEENASEPAAQAEAKAYKPFEGREKRDSSELDEYVEKALKIGEERRSTNEKEEDEAKHTAEQTDAFGAANEAYRSGDYEEAQEGYEKVIEAYGGHYGANVNLTLALLQQEKNDDALVQALVCMALYPTDDGALLNVQTAAVACGFSAEEALDDAALSVVKKVRGGSKLSKDMKAELEYNKLWDEIETELYDVAQGEATNGEYVYQRLLAAVDELADGELADDEDIEALRAYLIAVGTQLGLDSGETEEASAAEAERKAAEEKEKADDKASSSTSSNSTSSSNKDKADDKSKTSTSDKDKDKTDDKSKSSSSSSKDSEPDVDLAAAETHVGLPYVVADDEVGTIVFVGYHMSGDNPVAEFEFVNNSDERLHFAGDYEVTGNDKKVENFSAVWPTVNPGERESAWGSFFGTEGDDVISVVEGDLKQLSCVVKVGQWGSNQQKSYPLKWKADENQATKETETKLVEDENDVSMTITKVLPASDGVVALEYKGKFGGKGKLMLDGADWKVNGKDVELLGSGSPMGTGYYGHPYLLFHAKNADDFREGEITSLAGTLIIRDDNGKELVNKKLDVSFAN